MATDTKPCPDYVRSFKETAAILGMSERSFRRLVSKGQGPQITRLSKRLVGVRDSHRQEYLDSKVENDR